MRVAIHQPNFCPWYPFFYKMSMCDVFILLEHVQFEKNGYQNRFKYKDKWITKPVHNKTEDIYDKDYVGLTGNDISRFGASRIYGGSLKELNFLWIKAIKHTLNIKTDLAFDSGYKIYSKNKTERLIQLVKGVGGTVYVTNPDAKKKYLDEDLMRDNGIEIEYCKVPRHLQKSTFEILEEYGVEGAIKQLWKA